MRIYLSNEITPLAGIYIHIPFCRKACSYCNFHFSTSLALKKEMVAAIATEISLRKSFLGEATISTIYFGGGTPSLLNATEIQAILSEVYRHFELENDPEITLEANPDDLTTAYLNSLKAGTDINRLSIGVQSFHDKDLKFMDRIHNVNHAHEAIKNAKATGFNQLSLDLIFGNPTTSDDMWRKNLEIASGYDVDHISCYALTIEEKTKLAHQIKSKSMASLDESRMQRQFQITSNALTNNGFIHYEISNYGKPGKFAHHNTSYWKEVPYLGLGPAAHSFSPGVRSSNISNNKKYIDYIKEGEPFFVEEKLSTLDQYNEYIMTGLRTIWGVDQSKVEQFGKYYLDEFLKNTVPFLTKGWLTKSSNHFFLTKEGKLFADTISSELFCVAH